MSNLADSAILCMSSTKDETFSSEAIANAIKLEIKRAIRARGASKIADPRTSEILCSQRTKVRRKSKTGQLWGDVCSVNFQKGRRELDFNPDLFALFYDIR